LILGLWTLPASSFADGKSSKTDSISQGVSAAVSVHPASGAKSSPDAAIRKAFDEGRRLYKDLDPASSGEVAQINKSAGKGPTKVSAPMLMLLRVCQQISEWTQGLFDVVKTENNKEATLAVDFGRGEVALRDKKAWVDFNDVRGGYVVDRMAGTLKSEGFSDFMIQLKGAAPPAPPPQKKGKVNTASAAPGPANAIVRTMGRDGNDYWRLNVADPSGTRNLCRVSLEASSVATADVHGQRQPTTDLRSVTVIARNATNASGLARTALLAGKSRAGSMLGAIAESGFGAILEDQNGKIQTIGDVTAACFEE
jgi:thiamine biosynthesis lipoprotein ApbE